jgi:hypothetical protein
MGLSIEAGASAAIINRVGTVEISLPYREAQYLEKEEALYINLFCATSTQRSSLGSAASHAYMLPLLHDKNIQASIYF